MVMAKGSNSCFTNPDIHWSRASAPSGWMRVLASSGWVVIDSIIERGNRRLALFEFLYTGSTELLASWIDETKTRMSSISHMGSIVAVLGETYI
jgi:hypothetical protein